MTGRAMRSTPLALGEQHLPPHLSSPTDFQTFHVEHLTEPGGRSERRTHGMSLLSRSHPGQGRRRQTTRQRDAPTLQGTSEGLRSP